MIAYFARHPTAANILMMSIIALGLYSLQNLNKESFPLLKPSKVQVTITYPGASAADVEEGICNPLENATDGISFLKEQECDARDNLATFTLEMEETGNISEFTEDINTEIESISNFPDNIEDPIIKQLGRIGRVANVAITSDKLSASELKALAVYYQDRLIALPKIPIVTISGFSKHQLQVLIRPDIQQKYMLSIQNIADLISAQAIDLPMGTVESTDTVYQIRFSNIRRTADELANLVILNTKKGGVIHLGDIARIVEGFDNPEAHIELNGKLAALLTISKNTIDDTLTVADALAEFVHKENNLLPTGTRLTILSDTSTSVRDRLRLLIKNGWQGLTLVSLMLLLFFSWRYTFWIILGLPISFLGGLALMVAFGISINMISMVALLMAIGILMDDAIVLSENIDNEYKKGKSAIDAVIDGTKRVLPGITASFLTSALLFGSLLMMKGDLGQILGVLPIVLLSVLSISLIEAFLILPHHLKHSLEHSHQKKAPVWRKNFEARFSLLRLKVKNMATSAMQYRYLTVGIALMLFISSLALVVSGTVKFKAFPSLEGNNLEARVLLAQGTPFAETQHAVDALLMSLELTNVNLSKNENNPLIKNIQVTFSQHNDVPENGNHLATISVDILSSEERNTKMSDLIAEWKLNTAPLPEVLNIQFKEPTTGPAGRAIHIRLSGQDLENLSTASWKIQNWLRGYHGISNLLDDLRPGKPQYSIKLKPGALLAGIDSRSIASQLRAAYLEIEISEVYKGREAFEIIAKLDSSPKIALRDFDNYMVFSNTGEKIPLTSVATISEIRAYSRVGHVNHMRTVNVYGDVNADIANTSEVINDFESELLDELKTEYPGINFNLKGEVENGSETKISIMSGFALGIFGVFLLLSFQFRNYSEPLIVMVNIPLALIGTIFGHMIMGIDLTLPSMIGFVSLAGIVVNDSILLVEFVKYRVKEGMNFHDAASQAVHDRFRAIFLTSVTTIAGMTPLLFETSTQALILVPLVTSIVFGMLTSTVLILMVLPAMYAIMEDIAFITLTKNKEALTA